MAEVNYPSNSNKSKMQNQSNPVKVTGDIVIKENKKRKLFKAIFAEHIGEAIENAFWKKLLPKLKNAAVSGIHDAVNAAFNTNVTGGNGTNTNQTNYSGVYTITPGSILDSGNYNPNPSIMNNYPNRNDLRFPSKEDAEATLGKMKAAIADRGYVTVNMLYGWIGRSIDYPWNDYGWINVDSAAIVEDENNPSYYFLRLPKACFIDRE